MIHRDSRLEESRQRALAISEAIAGGGPMRSVRETIQDYAKTLDYATRLEDFGDSRGSLGTHRSNTGRPEVGLRTSGPFTGAS